MNKAALATVQRIMRVSVMQLNGKDLILSDNFDVPELTPVAEEPGTISLALGSCTFLVL